MTAPPPRTGRAGRPAQESLAQESPAPDVASPRATPDAQLAFKSAMRFLVGGVGVVTVAHGDVRGGLTATSLSSLSAEPPSLIVCVKQGASSLPTMRASGRFAVSLLGHGHEGIADRFAGRDGTYGAERFTGAEWVGEPGAPPVLADALAAFECAVDEMLDRYSHTIIIGRVLASHVQPAGSGALVYWQAAYDRVGRLED